MKCVCIVDALSSGSAYPKQLRERDCASVHVQSHDPILPIMAATFHREDHVDNIVFRGDVAACAELVARYQPVCVIPGAEVGVVLADALGEALGVPGNGSALSFARRDKLAMQDQVARAGLRSIPTHKAHDWASIERWLTGRRFPMVIKPPASASSDHVYICHDLHEARRAFELVYGAMTLFDRPTDAVIVQPFIRGTEYIVNTVGYAGHHFVTDLWRQDKLVGEHPLYDRCQLLPSRGVVQDRLVAYTEAVLAALGIRYGAAHTELMLDDEGPVLIEVGARLMGGNFHAPCQAVLGYSQMSVSLDAFLEPDRFTQRLERPYQLERQLTRIDLIAHRAGTLAALHHLDEIRALPSLFDLDMHAIVGGPIKATVDFATSPGTVDLVHEDADVIEADYHRIRGFEAGGMYEIAG